MDAMALGRIEDGLAFKAHHRLIVQLELDAGRRQQFLRHRRIHLNDLVRKILLNRANRIGGRLSQTTNGGIKHDLVQVF